MFSSEDSTSNNGEINRNFENVAKKFMANKVNKPVINNILDSSKLNFNQVVNYFQAQKLCNLEQDDTSLVQYFKDLEIFKGIDDSNSSILSKLNKTHTVFGFLKLKERLLNPIVDIKDLKEKVVFIKLEVQQIKRTMLWMCMINVKQDKNKQIYLCLNYLLVVLVVKHFV